MVHYFPLLSIFVDYTFISLLITNLCPHRFRWWAHGHLPFFSLLLGIGDRGPQNKDYLGVRPPIWRSEPQNTDRAGVYRWTVWLNRFDRLCVCRKIQLLLQYHILQEGLSVFKQYTWQQFCIVVGIWLLSILISIHRSGKNNKSLMQSYKNVGGVGY